MHSRAFIVPLLLLALSACGSGQQDPAPAAPGSAITTATNANGVLRVDPAQLSDCEPVVADVEWDVRSTHPQVAAVDIFVGPDAAPTLFASGGAQDSAKTGRWTVPGAIFRLLDHADSKELARVTVAGPACG